MLQGVHTLVHRTYSDLPTQNHQTRHVGQQQGDRAQVLPINARPIALTRLRQSVAWAALTGETGAVHLADRSLLPSWTPGRSLLR